MLAIGVAIFLLTGVIGFGFVLRASKDIWWLPLFGATLGAIAGIAAGVAVDSDRLTPDLLGVLAATCFSFAIAFALTMRVVGVLPNQRLERERKALLFGIELACLAAAVLAVLACYASTSETEFLRNVVTGIAAAEAVVTGVFLLVLALLPMNKATNASATTNTGPTWTLQVLGRPQRNNPSPRIVFDLGLFVIPLALTAALGFLGDLLSVVGSAPSSPAALGGTMAGFGATVFVLFAAGAPGGSHVAPGPWLGCAISAMLGTVFGVAIVYEPRDFLYAYGWAGIAVALVGATILARRQILPWV